MNFSPGFFSTPLCALGGTGSACWGPPALAAGVSDMTTRAARIEEVGTKALPTQQDSSSSSSSKKRSRKTGRLATQCCWPKDDAVIPSVACGFGVTGLRELLMAKLAVAHL